MSIYIDYLKQIEERKGHGLHPQPIDSAELLSKIIDQIKDSDSEYREDSLQFFIYNVLPGTTSAAGLKAKFLKEIIIGESVLEEITPAFAFEQLSHMKGGPSIEVLLDLASIRLSIFIVFQLHKICFLKWPLLNLTYPN